jgi:S1-C subfamily serine protease
MNRIPRFIFPVLLFLAVASTSVADPKSAAILFKENRMAVVHVEMATDPSSVSTKPSSGTGFIVGSDGYVLTAKHVISGYVNTTTTPITVRIGSLDEQPVPAEAIQWKLASMSYCLNSEVPLVTESPTK